MDPETNVAIDVEILGSIYHLRGGQQPERLHEAARYVDGKMREVAQQAATSDSGRLAILAALNIADELFQCRRREDGERVEIEQKVVALAGQLARALEG
jgi:cell division protein ZapA